MALVLPGSQSDHERVTDTPTKMPDGTSSVRHRTLWWILIGATVAVLVVIGVIVFSGGSSGVTGDQQLASVRQACAQWSGNSAPRLGADSASTACTTMADWMSEQLRDGQMTGPMMWGPPPRWVPPAGSGWPAARRPLSPSSSHPHGAMRWSVG